uniref:Uncharacterized protein n=1 Tax=Strongyloides stercoralis TaxID=6248 RepID=A0AAF5DFY1_STRER
MFDESSKKNFIHSDGPNKFYPKSIEYGNIYFQKTPIIFISNEELDKSFSNFYFRIFVNLFLYGIGTISLIYIILKFIKMALSNDSLNNIKSIDDNINVNDNS